MTFQEASRRLRQRSLLLSEFVRLGGDSLACLLVSGVLIGSFGVKAILYFFDYIAVILLLVKNVSMGSMNEVEGNNLVDSLWAAVPEPNNFDMGVKRRPDADFTQQIKHYRLNNDMYDCWNAALHVMD